VPDRARTAAGLPPEAVVDFAPKQPVPVFPLPRLVLFPHTVMPLHVFELRYRTMVREALSGERLIALAQLEPGYEKDYYGSPPFHALGCLARFEEVEWLPNDSYDLKVLGLSRVRFGRVVREFPYRAAEVALVPEAPYDDADPLVEMERSALRESCARWLAALAAQRGTTAAPGPGEHMRYEVLVNGACMLLGAELTDPLQLLAMDSVIERGRAVRLLMDRHLSEGLPPPAGEAGR
jgi:Lon protease-like protein